MRQASLPLPEIGAIAATRMLLGAGVGLLVADRLGAERRQRIAWPMVAIGAAATIPLLWDLMRRTLHEADLER